MGDTELKTKPPKKPKATQKVPKTSASAKKSKELVPNNYIYIPTKYQKSLKGKGKFNIPTHLSELKSDYLDQEKKSDEIRKEVLFKDWSVLLENISISSEEEAIEYLPGNSKGLKRVFLKSNSPNPHQTIPISLGRFESWTQFDHNGIPLGVPSEANLPPLERGVDVILNTGGPVWAMEWCPAQVTRSQQEKENKSSYIAISTTKSQTDYHAMGQIYMGKNAIQIWKVGCLTPKGIIGDETTKPQLSMTILHEKSYVRDLSWCHRGMKEEVDCPNEVSRLGLLAACFGDGSMDIFAIPEPEELAKRKNLPLDKPMHLFLKPIMTYYLGPNSMISTVKWSHHDKCNLIAAGCSDGRIAIWDLDTVSDDEIVPSIKLSYGDSIMNSKYFTSTDGKDIHNVTLNRIPILHFKSHNGYIQKICWSPDNPFYISACSMSSSVKVWDIRKCATPVDNQQSQGGMTNDLFWDRQNNSIISCLDDGGIRLISSDITKKFDYHQSSYVCGVNASPFLRFLASCDIDGRVFILPLIPGIDESRNHRRLRNQETILDQFNVSVQDGIQSITLYSSNEACIEENTIQQLSSPTKKPNKPASDEPIMFPDPAIACHRVKWNPNPHSPNWIAYGGCAGIVRIQLLRWLNPETP